MREILARSVDSPFRHKRKYIRQMSLENFGTLAEEFVQLLSERAFALGICVANRYLDHLRAISVGIFLLNSKCFAMKFLFL